MNSSVTISYNLTGEGQVVRGVRNIDNANKQMTTSTKHAGGAMAGLATRFVGLQAVMTYASQAARKTIAWVKDSIQKFREFDKAMAEVSTILKGDLYAGLAAMTVGVENLSEQWGKSTTDLAKGLYDILSAAVPAEDAMGLLATTTKASIAGITSVATSVDVFTSIMNAWGLAASQMHRISDQLFQTVIRGKLVFGDLASAMGYIAPIAANLGVEFDEVAAALSTVTRQGQHVDMATRGLALGLQNIADLSPKAAVAARKYGVDLSSTALRVGGLEYVLSELSDATSEYGMRVLPQMIANMRSLRVFMALAGKEGLEGYKYDLNELKNVTNETSEALAKMAATSKMQADIAAQSMERLQRSVGSAWHSVDIWYKKTQLWWGTLISGGDADKAVRNYEDRMRELQLGMLKVYTTQAKIQDMKPFSDVLKGYIGDWGGDKAVTFLENLSTIGDDGQLVNMLDGVQEHIDNIGKAATISELTSDFGELEIMMGALDITGEQYFDTISENVGLFDILVSGAKDHFGSYLALLQGDTGKFLKPEHKATKSMVIMPESTIKQTNDLIDSINTRLIKLKEEGKIDEELIPKIVSSATLSDFETAMATIISRTANWKEILEDLDIDTQASSIVFDYFKSGIEDLSTEIQTHKDNILELKNALMELNHEVTDVYETLGGQAFAGVKRWEIAVIGATASLDRFQHYASRTIKYGDEFDNTYMNNIKALDGFSGAVGDANDYLDYYNAAVWEATMADETWEGTIDDLVTSLGATKIGYEEAVKAIKDAKDALDEHRLAMQKNSLEMMKIELKGMLRRRGLTRSEEKALKKLKIANMEERIEMSKLELSETSLANQEMVEDTKDTFDELKEIYDEYIFRAGESIWEMKDVRASDIEDLIAWINMSEDKIGIYTTWMDEQQILLSETWRTYIGVLETLADKAPDLYERLFDDTAIEDLIADFKEWQSLIGVEIPVSHPGSQAQYEASGMTPNEWASATQGQSGVYSAAELLPGSARNNIEMVIHPNATGSTGSRSLARGTQYIPETAPYLLHRGEQVIPSGKDAGNGDVYINIVNNNDISTSFDMEEFASMQATAIAQQLSNKRTGKSNYRMR